jgi:hypothetical protein
VVNYQVFDGEDEELAFNLGVLWRATDRVSLGAVYRYGPSFGFDVRSIAGDDSQVFASERANFDLPDVAGVGIAVRPTEELSVSFEYNRVSYSDLGDDPVSVFANPPSVMAKLRAADADEFRAGAEYVFAGLRYPLALRGGVWRDPAHRVTHILGDLEDDPDGRAEAMLFREGDTVYHASFGGGLVIRERFQVDAAFDLSKRIDVFSLSGVVRF